MKPKFKIGDSFIYSFQDDNWGYSWFDLIIINYDDKKRQYITYNSKTQFIRYENIKPFGHWIKTCSDVITITA